MSVIGWVQGCSWQELGSELTANVAAGQVAIPVEWGGQFDDDGGTVLINGQQYTYSRGAIADGASPTDPDVITLDSPLVAGAAVGDPVAVYSGGQPLRDLVMTVSIGTQDGVGDDVEVIVPFAQRDLWPEGLYDEPIQVRLSDDMESLEDAPGRTPARDSGLAYVPYATGILSGGFTVPTGVWYAGMAWFQTASAGFTSDGTEFGTAFVTGFVPLESGLYLVNAAATFEGNPNARRGIRPMVMGNLRRSVIVDANDTSPTCVETSQMIRLDAQDVLQIAVYQDTGAGLDLTGGISTEVAIHRVAP